MGWRRMIFAAGWCVLRSSRSAYATTNVENAREIDSAIDASDAMLWASFREWMAANNSPQDPIHPYDRDSRDEGADSANAVDAEPDSAAR